MIYNPSIVFYPNSELMSEEDIQNFEKEIGYALPADYREFMKEFNGGDFKPAVDLGSEIDYYLKFTVPDFDGREYSFDISNFFSAYKDPSKYDILQIHEVMTEQWLVPKSLLAFANTAGNLKIFLGLDGSTKGQVLIGGKTFVDKYENGEDIEPTDFVCIATTFSAFLNQLVWFLYDD